MGGFCCCLSPSLEDQRELEESINTIPRVCPSSPPVEDGCCCYPFVMTCCPNCGKRSERYRFKKVPQVCDAAVETDIIITQDIIGSDYNDRFCQGESFEEADMQDHKYASLQFDAKPGKVRYVEGSQVFFVEVRDEKLAVPFRRDSFDKSISEEEEVDIESDISTDLISDMKSDNQRRDVANSEAKVRKKRTENQCLGINYSSPSTSMDDLTKKETLNRVFLHKIEEAQEITGDANFQHKDDLKETKEGYNIDGGHFSRNVLGSEDDDISNLKPYSRTEMSSSPHSVHSCIQVPYKKPEVHVSQNDSEVSEFTDVSNHSIQGTSQSSIHELYSPVTTTSSEITDTESVPVAMFQESLFVHEVPKPKRLTEDPSGLLVADRIHSVLVVNNVDQTIRETLSCPNLTITPGSENTSSFSPILTRENSLVSESTDTQHEVFSVETQTDLLEEPAVKRSSMISVCTETECGSQEMVPNDDTTGSEGENNSGSGSDNSGSDNSVSESKHSDLSGSSSENSSSSESECGSTSNESGGTSNAESRHPKKTPKSLHSDSSGSSCSSCPTSVREIDSVPHESKDPEELSNSKSSYAGSSGRNSSNTSSSSSISSSSSFSSDSITGHHSDSTKEGCGFDASNSNG